MTDTEIPLFTSTANTKGDCPLSDGCHLSYEIHGTGEHKIMLIMGLLASRYSWRDALDYYMSQPQDKYSVLVYDNRGCGMSSAPWGRYTTKMLATDALELLDHVGWTEDRSIHVNGISMGMFSYSTLFQNQIAKRPGGMIAMELALLVGSRMQSLTLTSTCAKHQNPPRTRAESAVNWVNFFRPKFSDESKTQSMMDALFVDQAWLDTKLPSGETNRQNIFKISLNRIKHAPPPPFAGRVGQTAACLTHDCSFTDLATIGKTIPDILIITGDQDKLIDPVCTETMYREISDRGAQKNVRKIILKGKGHALPAEASTAYQAEVDTVMEAGKARWQK